MPKRMRIEEESDDSCNAPSLDLSDSQIISELPRTLDVQVTRKRPVDVIYIMGDSIAGSSARQGHQQLFRIK